jgi:hypothetical protein
MNKNNESIYSTLVSILLVRFDTDDRSLGRRRRMRQDHNPDLFDVISVSNVTLTMNLPWTVDIKPVL